MAKEIVPITRSDASGEVIPTGESINLVVRNHSKLDEAKQIDLSKAELQTIKLVTGVIPVDVRPEVGEDYTVFVTETELAKVVPLDVLQKADGLRGRRSGTSPRSNGA
ncbi:hypothetical protein [Mycolicibacterium sp. PDY-3]|uniref:hypothetical protein n=1 Tax=Mycolicibacterium sp. PDY-3 TaxID=3376069 RepID=UPI0037AA71EB